MRNPSPDSGNSRAVALRWRCSTRHAAPWRNKHCQGRRQVAWGQAIVETAVVITVLLAVTMFIIQFGLILNARITLTNLAREGARYAAIHGRETTTNYAGVDRPTDDAIREYIRDQVRQTSLHVSDIPTGNITVTPAAGTTYRTSGQTVTVRIAYDMRRRLFLPGTYFGLGRLARNVEATGSHVVE